MDCGCGCGLRMAGGALSLAGMGRGGYAPRIYARPELIPDEVFAPSFHQAGVLLANQIWVLGRSAPRDTPKRCCRGRRPRLVRTGGGPVVHAGSTGEGRQTDSILTSIRSIKPQKSNVCFPSMLGGSMSGSVTRRGWYSPTLKAMSSASLVDGFGPIPGSRRQRTTLRSPSETRSHGNTSRQRVHLRNCN
ncbi:MAG: hypothetical protein K0S72_1913 [Arthrobacter sp.]|nr:hypothetical protein [Arthrobacter sp.]